MDTVWMPDGKDGWFEVGHTQGGVQFSLGYVDRADLDLADSIQKAYTAVLPAWLSPDQVGQARLFAHEYGFGTVEARPVQTLEPTPGQLWIERRAKTTVDPGRPGGGWRSGPVRWSERAIRRLADTYPHGWQRSRVLFNWAANPDLQGTAEPHPFQGLFDRAALHQQARADQWSQVFGAIPRTLEALPSELVNDEFYDPAAVAEKALKETIRQRQIRQGQTTWDEDWYDA